LASADDVASDGSSNRDCCSMFGSVFAVVPSAVVPELLFLLFADEPRNSSPSNADKNETLEYLKDEEVLEMLESICWYKGKVRLEMREVRWGTT